MQLIFIFEAKAKDGRSVRRKESRTDKGKLKVMASTERERQRERERERNGYAARMFCNVAAKEKNFFSNLF